MQTSKHLAENFADVLLADIRLRLGHLVSAKNSMIDLVLSETRSYFVEHHDLLYRFYALRNKHSYGYVHSIDVAVYSLLIGAQQYLPLDELRGLCIGGILHDIGKLFVDTSILESPSKLTDKEFDVIRHHPENGVDIYKKYDNNERIANIIGQHHEKLNGKGYPLGLRGTEIDDLAKIVTVADIFDAVTTTRSYHKGQDVYKGMEALYKSANEADPEIDESIVSNLFEVVTYPACYAVRLFKDSKLREAL